MDGLCLKAGFRTISPAIGSKSMLPQRSPSSSFHFGYSLKSLWPGGADDEKRCDGLQSKDAESKDTKGDEPKWKWVLKILHNKSPPGHETVADEVGDERNVSGETDCGGDEECGVCSVDEEEIEFDRESFSRMLTKVSLSETKLCAQLSYLGNLAYSISKIKAGKLWKFHRLRFVTSSFEKRQVASKPGDDNRTAVNKEVEGDIENKGGHNEPQCSGHEGSVSAAYRMAASAAAFLQSHTRALLPLESFKPKSAEGSNCTGNSGQVDETMNSDTPSLTTAKDTMTAVVAAEEEARRDVADDLNSKLSSPCEWFICDDEWSSTRFFVIQGSESLASWQANLVFEPTQFEGMDVLVHRGIYDAAKVMYAQMLPEVSAHVQAHGRHALFRFTGHSLGGSLSLLISLMLLIRGEVPSSGLLPVITYGSPSIMCGGDHLLHELGLPRSHVRAMILHRDIVPRVFACHYPTRLSGLLKAVKGNFRNHPCLNNQELLYSPMGELLILQPDEKFSPQHHLLPCGCGLYLLSCPWFPFQSCWKQLAAAERLFFNSPHPLEILGERAAYGSEGSIHRDHDMKSYLGSLRGVIRAEEKSRRKDRRVRIHTMWWYLVLQVGIQASILLVRSVASLSMGQQGFDFSVISPNWNEPSKRLNRVVIHMLVLMLNRVKLLALKVRSVISCH